MENQSTTSSSSSSQLHFLLLEQVEFLKVNDDSLLQWELVNVVDAEEEGDDDIDGGFGSWDSSTSSPNNAPVRGTEGIPHRLSDTDVGVEDHSHPHDADADADADDGDASCGYGQGDDEDDDDEYDLDDELVPWYVSNKLGRQRMRKLGKRAFSKMHNSKRSPHLFVSPGCLRGKHGLGLKHNY